MTVTVFIAGLACGKGSCKAFYARKLARAIVVQDNADRQRPWASAIAEAVAGRFAAPYRGPIELGLTFSFSRPKSHFGRRGLRKGAPAEHVQRPDLDKLARLTLDALTGLAYLDDSQVTRVGASKRWPVAGEGPGLALVIETGDDEAHGREAGAVADPLPLFAGRQAGA